MQFSQQTKWNAANYRKLITTLRDFRLDLDLWPKTWDLTWTLAQKHETWLGLHPQRLETWFGLAKNVCACAHVCVCLCMYFWFVIVLCFAREDSHVGEFLVTCHIYTFPHPSILLHSPKSTVACVWKQLKHIYVGKIYSFWEEKGNHLKQGNTFLMCGCVPVPILSSVKTNELHCIIIAQAVAFITAVYILKCAQQCH